MSLLANCAQANNTTNYSAPNLPAGVAYGLPWALNNTVYTATISVPSITATSAVSLGTQINTALTTNIATDLSNAWLMGALVLPGVGIKVIIYGLPANNPANYGIAWALTTI